MAFRPGPRGRRVRRLAPVPDRADRAAIIGPDYFNTPSDNVVYNRGPIMNLVDSPSFPAATHLWLHGIGLLLAVLVPERYPQMIARAAEYGNDRILMGAHYAMDVMGGRTLATYDLAHLLANDPAYLGQSFEERARRSRTFRPP